MPALGIDIAGVEDIDLFGSYAEPARAAAEAVMRSLLHSPGRLWWAPQQGYDLRQDLNAFFDASRTQAGVQAQCEQDERVASASVVATVLGDELRLNIELRLVQNDTIVRLTLTIDQLGTVINATVFN
jgi:hypothetical protein